MSGGGRRWRWRWGCWRRTGRGGGADAVDAVAGLIVDALTYAETKKLGPRR